MMEDVFKKLYEMKFSSMAQELEILVNSIDYADQSTNTVIEKLVDAEYYSRINKTIKLRLDQARLSDSTARLENIDYDPKREINSQLVQQLSTNDYITAGRNVIILGATGSGKSFLANALGVNACTQRYIVMYSRLSEIISVLIEARVEGNYRRKQRKILNVDLLIIDDFLLMETTPSEQKELFEIIDYRSNNSKSTIVCSQCSIEEWHPKLGGGYVADSILDRLTNNSYKIILKGESQRKLRRKIEE